MSHVKPPPGRSPGLTDHLFLALCAACLMAPSALASQTLRPVADKENVGKSGRAWMVRAPGSGDGSMRQLDAVSPAAVGDGKGDQGWGYLMCFGVTDAFAAQTLAADAVVTLTLKTAQALGGGSHAPVKLYLLSAKQEPGAFSQFGAYNVAPDKAAHETTIPGDAADQTLTLDLTAMLKKAGGVEPVESPGIEIKGQQALFRHVDMRQQVPVTQRQLGDQENVAHVPKKARRNFFFERRDGG